MEAGLAFGYMPIKCVAAINARNCQLAGAGKLAAAAFFDELFHHLLPIAKSHIFNDADYSFTHINAGRHFGFFI